MILTTGYAGIKIKSLRGLAGQPVAYGLRAVKFGQVVAARYLGYVPLQVGQETEIDVEVSSLSPNSNLKQANASLHVFHNVADKPDETRIERVTEIQDVPPGEGQPEGRQFKVTLDLPASPSNVSLRLDGGDPFWTFPGELKKNEYELPDLSEEINAYLDRLADDTETVVLRFLLKSDSPGQVKITLQDLEHTLIQTQIWRNLQDDTVRLDRNIPLAYNQIERIALDAIAEERVADLASLTVDVAGEFTRDRLMGTVETHDGGEFATINSHYSLAQRITVASTTTATGVSGYFATHQAAELYIALQSDEEGTPQPDATLTQGTLSLPPGDKAGGVWRTLVFDQPVELQAAEPYWILMKGVQGDILLGLQQQQITYLQQLLVNRGGQLWKDFVTGDGPLAMPLLRLVYQPGPDNQAAAVELGIEGMASFKPLDPQPHVQIVQFEPQGGVAGKRPVILIRSHAEGVLTIANVIQEYT